ncbi:MAG: ankyrin repeat domain-containing protein [Micavibrio sp.]|nr:ankyrin repeat domain-containing protein [Micavibrio sp.]
MTPSQSFNQNALRIPPHDRQRFFVAAKTGNVHTMRVMLAERPDAVHWRLGGKTALVAAIENKQLPAVTFLLKQGCDVNAKTDDNLSSPIHAAAACNNEQILIQLLHSHARVNLAKAGDTTPVMTAARANATRTLAILLQHGAPHTTLDDDGNAALHIATSSSRMEAAQTLIDNGADINLRNRDGHTPLMLAARERNLKAYKFLIEAGADETLRDDLNETARDMVQAFGSSDEKFIAGYHAMVRDRDRMETQKLLPKFHTGTDRTITASKPVRFKNSAK